MGRSIIQSGGVWQESISEQTFRLNGLLMQTAGQRSFAREFGTSFCEVDGTHDTTMYGNIAVLFTTVDSLGKSIIAGVATMEAENSKDIIKAADQFGLSCEIPKELPHVYPAEVESIPINNRAAQNSQGTTWLTDEGSWAHITVTNLSICSHGFCLRHKTTGMNSASKGLGELAESFRSVMHNILCKDFESEHALNQAFTEALLQYGHAPNARTYIENIQKNARKFCHFYMKEIFTHGHTTTQRAEGMNDNVKGHGDLRAYLRRASHVQCLRRVNNVCRDKQRRMLDELSELRLQGKRISTFYSNRCKQSMLLSATNIKCCALMEGTRYSVTKADESMSTVDMATKIVHLGNVYCIASCDCSYWKSTMIHCQCIIRCISECEDVDVDDIKLVHPLFHVERHPLWALALKKVKLENYDDFLFNNSPSLQCAESTNAQLAGWDNSNVHVVPSSIWDRIETIPAAEDARISMVRESFKIVESKVGRGNSDVCKMALARLVQLANELEGMIDPHTGEGIDYREPITKIAKKKAKAKDKNLSAMSYHKAPAVSAKSAKGVGKKRKSSGAGSNKAKRAKGKGASDDSAVATGLGPCSWCYQLNRAKAVNYRIDHNPDTCGNYQEYRIMMDMQEDRIGKEAAL